MERPSDTTRLRSELGNVDNAGAGRRLAGVNRGRPCCDDRPISCRFGRLTTRRRLLDLPRPSHEAGVSRNGAQYLMIDLRLDHALLCRNG